MIPPLPDATKGIESRRFYVLGGHQRHNAAHTDEWNWYDTAVILEVNPTSGSALCRMTHRTPPENCAPDSPSIAYKLSTLMADRLYTCTSTEVIVYRLPDFSLDKYISHPRFNDLHHVTVSPHGELIVVSTGLDMIVVMSPEGVPMSEIHLSEISRVRFSNDRDYRGIVTTKPHQVHPNYVFFQEGELWVTRFEQRDAIRPERPEERFEIGIERPHDGVVRFGKVYFTTVDGHVCVFDAKTRKRELALDLNSFGSGESALGWCRGIEVLSPQRVVVGFTRLRPTKLHEMVLWARQRFGDDRVSLSEPTRIVCYDLERRVRLWQMPLEDYGLNSVFGIHAADHGLTTSSLPEAKLVA